MSAANIIGIINVWLCGVFIGVLLERYVAERRVASGTLTEGGDVEQAPSDSLSGPTGNAGDAQ